VTYLVMCLGDCLVVEVDLLVEVLLVEVLLVEVLLVVYLVAVADGMVVIVNGRCKTLLSH